MESLSIDFSGRGTREHVAALETRLQSARGHEEQVRLRAALAIAVVEADAARARSLAAQLLIETADFERSRGRAAALVAAGVAYAGPEDSTRRVEFAQRALEICSQLGERGIAETAWFLLLGALAEVGDFARIDRELSPKHTSASSFQFLLEGRHAVWVRAMRAIADGRAADAEHLAGHGYELALAAGDPDAETVLRGQLAVVRWLQGNTADLVSPLLEARQLFPEEPVWSAALAWVWFGQGTVAPATEIVKTLEDVAGLPRDRNWLAAVAIVADVAAAVGTLAQVRSLYTALEPFSERLAVIGHGVTCWGPVARPLARLAKRLGDQAAAERYLRESIATCARLGAQAWLAEAQFELAQLLQAQGESTAEAHQLAREAAITAHRIGMPSIEMSARRLLQQLAPQASVRGSPLPGAGEEQARMPRVWVFGRFRVADVTGTTVVWRSRKAELLLKVLMSRRGTLIPREELMDVMWPGISPAALSNRFAVALSTVRRALDPAKEYAHDYFIEVDADLVLARFDRFASDSGEFLAAAALEIRQSADRIERAAPASAEQCAAMGEVLALADEPVFAGDRDALWAERLRRDVEAGYSELAHSFAHELRGLRDWARAAQLYRRLLELDVYDESAHAGLVACLTRQGAHGLAREARDRAQLVLSELGIVPRTAIFQ